MFASVTKHVGGICRNIQLQSLHQADLSSPSKAQRFPVRPSPAQVATAVRTAALPKRNAIYIDLA